MRYLKEVFLANDGQGMRDDGRVLLPGVATGSPHG
jgi:hypothetical protein